MNIKILLMVIILSMMVFGSALAQSNEPDIQLRLQRAFGYQSGNKIQGSFSLQISSEEDITSVDYLIDGQVLATVSDSPYKVSFSTSSYLPGEHAIQAIASKADGERLNSQVIWLTFITAEESWKSAGRIVAWILGGSLIFLFIGVFGTGWLLGGTSRFVVGDYGVAGGAVCARCQLPFSRHFLSPNLILGKLERCPHCGKIAIVPRADHAALEVAEARYREDQVKGQREFRQEEDVSQRLEDTRYES